MIRRIGILGGTFDPIHLGHIEVGDAAMAALGLTRMYVVPANVPPHRPQPSASSYHRFAMVALAILGKTPWRASDVELRAPAPSFTSKTLRWFRDRGYQPSELFFVIGADAFLDIAAWRDYPDILDAANFAVVSRPGCGVDGLPERLPGIAERMVRAPARDNARREPSIVLVDAPTADVSSTMIRQRRAAGEPIASLVPPPVHQHIDKHQLYVSTFPGRRRQDALEAQPSGRIHGEE